MRIDILTVVPELLTSPLNESILHRAQEKGLVQIVVHNLHDYAHDRRKTTDDYPFGGEAGMVLKCEPVFELIEKLQSERHYDEIIYTSPDGIRYDQHEANRLSTLDNIIILCGHYKGIDHRIREHLVTREISIGDYVLTGGELAACIIADSVVRIIPGAIGDEASALTDSFQDNLLAPPVGRLDTLDFSQQFAEKFTHFLVVIDYDIRLSVFLHHFDHFIGSTFLKHPTGNQLTVTHMGLLNSISRFDAYQLCH